MIHNKYSKVLLVALATLLSLQYGKAQTMMPIPNQSYTYSSSVRGYWFTAPVDFTIVGLRVPSQAGSGAQRIQVIRINDNTPVSYPTTSSNFTTLALIYNATNGVIQNVSIPITAGQKIAILGTAGTTNSYGDPTSVTSSISGNNVTLRRMGYQGNMPSTGIPNYWTEPSGYISRVEMYYETCHTAITSNPSPVTVCEDQQAKFNASATDVSTYQWQVDEGNGFIDVNNGANYDGATSNSLTVKNIPFSFDANKYRCLAMKSTCIDTSNNAQLSVNGLVHLDPLPAKDTTCIHASKDLEVKGTGSLVSYKWQVYVNGMGFIDLPNQYPYIQSGNKLTIADVLDTLDGSQFRCLVTGVCDAATSNSLTLTVNAIPTVAIPPKDVNATNGQKVVFNVQASGKYATYRWQVAGPDTFAFINDGGIYSGVNTNILWVKGVSRAQDGFKFRCIVGTSSGCITPGDTSDFATLSVEPPASVNSVSGEEFMVLYPNPTGSAELFIKMSSQANIAQMKYKVVDKTGRTVVVGNINTTGNRTSVDVSRLPAGIYMVRVLDEGNKPVARSRFTKL